MVGNSAGNIGRCEVACTPDQDFADPTCPEYLRTCHPPAPSAEEFCSASGVTPTGGACDVRQPTCQPGDSCVNAFGRRLGDDGPSADGTCTRSCATFGDASECGATEVCALNWLTASTAVGHCMEQDVDPSGCTEDFQACGNHSVCFDAGQGLFCMELCDLDNDQCSSGTCTQLFQDNDIRVGACV
jgi:hypothetical protein